MENILQQIFTSEYDRTSFEDNVLKPIFKDSAQKFVLYDKDGEQEITLTETDLRTAKRVFKYGEFTTHDNRKVELYEITVEDFSKVKIARVGLGALVKKIIIGNNAVFATFRYEDTRDKHWRFSFIAYDSFFQDGQVQTTETNPKRYTYVFGDEHETYRTATDRFLELESKNKIKVKDIQDAFAVEAMSKEFFDEYRETHYAKFIKYLTGDEFIKKGGKYELVPVQNPSPFLASVFNGDKITARDFCKKLLGQIVFLYFLQKKGWMGSPTGNYKDADGDKNFMQNFFNQAGADDTFYTVWLTKLFYDTLNKERENDDFEMPDKSIVKIPYLNGGLFDKESEKHDFLTFPKELFADLFEFFNRFNFTIYENSPEERTVAVDPEMLGHIFENLLEDNKDKGTFYTPKEIVHYMTQESLIEYLITHLGENTKDSIDLFVKQKNKEQLSDEQLNEINSLLDKVKICDPAIGSGAFPMGLLQEIFMLKERIAFDLGFSVWSPATVKENIIQNSIYGVDIEKGAVDIAQLRFWLSLIVDADVPKALPNLAYKIVVGNSLVSKFEDEVIEIDWSTDSAKGGLFAHELIEKKIDLLKQISEKQKLYFKAKGQKKEKLAKEIRTLKLDILSTELKVMIETKGTTLDGNAKPTKRQMEGFLQTEGWRKALAKIQHLKNNDEPFSHFDWALDFPELLNPLIIEDKDKRGFDIIIANPPYLKERGNANIFKGVNESNLGKLWHQGKMDYWFYFLHKSIDIVNGNGLINFITSRYWINSTGATKLINRIQNQISFVDVVDIGKLKVFDNVAGHHMIHLYSRSKKSNFFYKKLSNILSDINTKSNTKNIEILNCYNEEVFVGNEIVFGNRTNTSAKIFELRDFFDISQGVVEASDRISSKMFKAVGDDRFKIGQGVFVLTESEVKSLNLNSEEKNALKPYVDPSEINRYTIKRNELKFLIYSDSDIRVKIAESNNFNSLKNHLDTFSPFITSSNRPYGLHRARDKKYFESPKILFKSMFKKNEFFYDKNKLYFGMSFSSIINSTNYDLLPNLLTILNSKFALNWFYKNGKHRGVGVDIGVEKLRTFPIAENFTINSLKILSELMAVVLSTHNSIDEQVPNSHIAESFDDVIDALIFELYFPIQFREKDIEIEKYANSIFKPIDGLSDEEQLTTIRETYQILREKENPLRNQVKLMKIELKELLLPILSV